MKNESRRPEEGRRRYSMKIQYKETEPMRLISSATLRC
jgi:hypothetical protein